MELRVDFLDKSNINRIATASLQTRGSIFTNSRCPSSGYYVFLIKLPPRSQILKVISVPLIAIVFSIKFTPIKMNG
jgi:hypothetical protein